MQTCKHSRPRLGAGWEGSLIYSSFYWAKQVPQVNPWTGCGEIFSPTLMQGTSESHGEGQGYSEGPVVGEWQRGRHEIGLGGSPPERGSTWSAPSLGSLPSSPSVSFSSHRIASSLRAELSDFLHPTGSALGRHQPVVQVVCRCLL